MSHALRELKQRRRRLQRERHKSNRFRLAKKKNNKTTLYVHPAYLYISIFFSWTLTKSFRIQLQNKFANERLTNKRDGTSAIKFEVKRIHILSHWPLRGRRRRCSFNKLPHATSKQSKKIWGYNKILILHFSHSYRNVPLSQTKRTFDPKKHAG